MCATECSAQCHARCDGRAMWVACNRARFPATRPRIFCELKIMKIVILIYQIIQEKMASVIFYVGNDRMPIHDWKGEKNAKFRFRNSSRANRSLKTSSPKGVATTPKEFSTRCSKTRSQGVKWLQVPLSSSFRLILAKKNRPYHLPLGLGKLQSWEVGGWCDPVILKLDYFETIRSDMKIVIF